MVLRSRKWRLLIRIITLVVTTSLMLAFAAPASYALQDDTPVLLTHIGQLFDDELPLDGAYVHAVTTPDLGRIATTEGLGTTYYWVPLPEYGNNLFVRTDGYTFLRDYARTLDLHGDTATRPVPFYGKISTLKSQIGSEQVIEGLAEKGIAVDADTAMVLSQGEEPRIYRPMVPVVGALAFFWVGAPVGLLQIWRGRDARRRRARSSLVRH